MAHIWVVFGASFRIGEASLPGPVHSGDGSNCVPEVVFRLGTCNPNGISDKAHFFRDSEVDILGVTETHLTGRGLKVFRGLLKSAAPQFKWFAHGKCVLPRGQVSDTGMWSGVGVISQWPTHSLPHDWSPPVFETGRICVTSSFIHGLWISGCVVYGTPCGPTHPQAKGTTNALIREALRRVLQLSGPRYVCGDFNHDAAQLEAVHEMKRAGFVDLQDLHLERTGIPPSATCRGKTRRDYCFVSPELIPMFRSCQVLDFDWSDHSSVVGTFSCEESDRWRFPWPVPDPIDWKSMPRRSEGVPVDFMAASSPSEAYALFWSQVEQEAVRVSLDTPSPLSHRCLGRGARSAPLATKFQVAPIRVGRSGDIKPSFLGLSQQHRQWFRQLRRLESYKRLVRRWTSVGDADHRVDLWNSIVNAAGFRPSFAGWWRLSGGRNSPLAAIPVVSPDFGAVEIIFEFLEGEFRTFEHHLRKHQSYAKKLGNGSSINALFKAVRRDPPAPVDLLSRSISSVISGIDEQDCAIELTDACSWVDNCPFVHAGVPFSPLVVTSDKLYLSSTQGFSIGDQVVQTQQTGKLQDLFDAFHAQWSLRWKRHDHVAASQWNQIMDFARSTLRPVSAVVPNLDLQAFRNLVRSKSKKTATGLDGVSAHDVASLSDTHLRSLLSLFQRAEHDGSWPSSVMAGAVRSLAKIAEPQTTGDYRPITILSLIYRLWSSFQARHWLRALNHSLHPLLCGNRPECSTGTVWRWILQEIEQARHINVPVSGFVADLVKAYNTLPRLPTLYAAKLMGISHGVTTAWAGALSSVRRHFAVRQSFSAGLDSSTGFPEGCAMSCVGMLILDELLHRWLQALSPSVCGLTFVDNWEVLVKDEQWLRPAFQRLEAFVSMLDLQLDRSKTYFWSTAPEIRAQLRTEGKLVRLSARDLGAHVVYSRQLSNKTVALRIQDLQPFWPQLAAASGTHDQKFRVIRSAAWPRAFHACAAVVIGRRLVGGLRAECLRSVKLNKPGASPLLQFCVEKDGTDPQQWIITETIRSFREASGACPVDGAIDVIVQGEVRYMPGTLHEVLYQRLQQLGWRVVQGTCVEDHIGRFDLLTVDWGSLLLRIHWAWTLAVAGKLSHRPSFEAFWRVDRLATMRGLRVFPDFDQGILRRHLNGSLLVNSVCCKWTSSGSDRCKLCGALDTLSHRLWSCVGTAALRDQLDGTTLSVVSSMPEVSSVHGWTLDSPFADVWRAYLVSLPASVPELVGVPPTDTIVDVFTDGSCHWPTEPDYRVAAFSVVLAPALCFDNPPGRFQILAASPLAGLIQTAYRAELMAFLTAISYAARYGWFVRVWMDCQSVITKYWKLVQMGLRLKPSSQHADLWGQILQIHNEVGSDRIQVVKVPAHESAEVAESSFEQWVVQGNSTADIAAKQANLAREPVVWRVWERHARAIHTNRYLGQSIREHIVRVAHLWAQSGEIEDAPRGQYSMYGSGARLPQLTWPLTDPLQLVGTRFVKYFGNDFANVVTQWFNELWSTQFPVRWVTYLQLFVIFQLQLGEVGVAKVNGQWIRFSQCPGSTPEQYHTRQLAKWFRLMLQQLLKDGKCKYVSATTRPWSSQLMCHIGCLGLPLRPELQQCSEKWLADHMDRPARGQGSTISVPLVG